MVLRQHAGFTMVEIVVTLVVMAVIAAMLVPKIIDPEQKAQENAMIQEAYSTLGEMELARRVSVDTTHYPPENLSNAPTAEMQFYNYLVNHLDAKIVSTSGNYCPATGNPALGDTDPVSPLFTMPLGEQITSICAVTNGAETSMQIGVWVPLPNNPVGSRSTSFTVVVPNGTNADGSLNGIERYTTLYGYDLANNINKPADCVAGVDPTLNVVKSCP